MKRTAALAVLLLAAVSVGVWGYGYVRLQIPMAEVISEDARNEGIKVSVHYERYIPISPSIAFDLRGVTGSKSMMDVFRVLLQFAERMKDQSFQSVVLCYRGKAKFRIEGDYFRELGDEYGYQNPAYTTRTFPEHLLTPDGQAAYDTWTGGWLGVMGEQMEDFSDFHEKWYMDDLLLGK